MNQAVQEKRIRNVAVRASRPALESRPRFDERSLRNSAHAHRRSMIAQRRLEEESRSGHRGSGSMSTIAGILVLAAVAYVAYTFVAGSGVLL